MKILVVSKQRLTDDFISREGSLSWNVTHASNAEDASSFLQFSEFQAIIVEIGNHPLAALESIKLLASLTLSVPIIAASSERQDKYRTDALKLGAITFIQLTSSFPDIEAAVRAVVRHTQVFNSSFVTVGDITLDYMEKRFHVLDVPIRLTLRQYQLLELLFLNKGKLVSRERIMNHLYGGSEEPHVKIVDVLICKIRTTLKVFLGDQTIIETVRGFGFRVNCCAEKSS